MEFFHLLDSVAGIEINVAERNNLAGMLSAASATIFREENGVKTQAVSLIEPQSFRRSLMKSGFFSSKCTCMSTIRSAVGDDSGGCFLAIASAPCPFVLHGRELTATVLAAPRNLRREMRFGIAVLHFL
jgi:hypothetical protein